MGQAPDIIEENRKIPEIMLFSLLYCSIPKLLFFLFSLPKNSYRPNVICIYMGANDSLLDKSSSLSLLLVFSPFLVVINSRGGGW